MRRTIGLVLVTNLILGCGEDDGKTYVGENNFYTMEPTKIRQFTEDSGFVSQQQLMPKYFVYRAKEWPREDLNDASSYDLPRVQFFWANLSNDRGYEPHPMYNEYEGQVKIWSMKTDGTDLRLVVDELPIPNASGSGKMVRSPNNRYLAFGYSGTGKAVYDLKTKEIFRLGVNGPIGFLWAEDSSYLYYRTRDTSGKAVYKWDVTTHEKSKVDFYLSDTGIIKNGEQYILAEGGLRISPENTEEPLEVLTWANGLDFKHAFTLDRSISPLGNYAWAKNHSFSFHVDSRKNTVTRTDSNKTSGFPYIVGLDAKYLSTSKNAMVMEVRELATKKAWSWRPLGHNRTLENISLYNALANDGKWFRESG